MSDINSIIKAEDLDNISDNDLYELDNEEKTLLTTLKAQMLKTAQNLKTHQTIHQILLLIINLNTMMIPTAL